MATLTSRTGERVCHDLPAGSATLGRDVGCDVLVDDNEVSRTHARLDETDGQWRVTDLRSRNGTFVNGTPVTTAPLRSGDDLKIGTTVFTFHLSVDPRATVASDRSEATKVELSAREREVLALLADGQTDREIAEALVINIKTVQSHLDRIRDKTGCRRRAELTRWALSNDIA